MGTSKVPHRILFMGLIVSFILLAAAINPAAQSAEGEYTISGKITKATIGKFVPFAGRRVIIEVQDGKGKSHTIHLGRRTAYVPRRYPAAGDNVTVQCIKQRGVDAGLSVTYK